MLPKPWVGGCRDMMIFDDKGSDEQFVSIGRYLKDERL